MSTAVGIPRKWTVADSAEVYGVKYWGHNYFSVGENGNVQAHPGGGEAPAIDLKELVDAVARRGIGLPLLIRFSDVLRSRIVELNETFKSAIAEYGYKGEFKGVYPIKVNQHRYVVEEIIRFGRPYHYGLEAGSKPELLAVMAMLDDEDALIICNGYKDEEYIETALMASKLGRASESASSWRRRGRGAGRRRAATGRSSACRRARWSRRSTSSAPSTC
jgi:arginine decarboxylase